MKEDQTQKGSLYQQSGTGEDVAGQRTELETPFAEHSSLSMAQAAVWDGGKQAERTPSTCSDSRAPGKSTTGKHRCAST